MSLYQFHEGGNKIFPLSSSGKPTIKHFLDYQKMTWAMEKEETVFKIAFKPLKGCISRRDECTLLSSVTPSGIQWLIHVKN